MCLGVLMCGSWWMYTEQLISSRASAVQKEQPLCFDVVCTFGCCNVLRSFCQAAAKFPLNIHWTGSPLGMSVSETQVRYWTKP